MRDYLEIELQKGNECELLGLAEDFILPSQNMELFMANGLDLDVRKEDLDESSESEKQQKKKILKNAESAVAKFFNKKAKKSVFGGRCSVMRSGIPEVNDE